MQVFTIEAITDRVGSKVMPAGLVFGTWSALEQAAIDRTVDLDHGIGIRGYEHHERIVTVNVRTWCDIITYPDFITTKRVNADKLFHLDKTDTAGGD